MTNLKSFIERSIIGQSVRIKENIGNLKKSKATMNIYRISSSNKIEKLITDVEKIFKEIEEIKESMNDKTDESSNISEVKFNALCKSVERIDIGFKSMISAKSKRR
jgi:succinate dehydrogenase/fumarate reductase-like Fe-S protein